MGEPGRLFEMCLSGGPLGDSKNHCLKKNDDLEYNHSRDKLCSADDATLK